MKSFILYQPVTKMADGQPGHLGHRVPRLVTQVSSTELELVTTHYQILTVGERIVQGKKWKRTPATKFLVIPANGPTGVDGQHAQHHVIMD